MFVLKGQGRLFQVYKMKNEDENVEPAKKVVCFLLHHEARIKVSVVGITLKSTNQHLYITSRAA
jgi:archaellum component FlaF (FlaF/FlaG flagellin family)